MSWVRLDDRFPEHPKVAAVPSAAAWLHVCALCYCNRNLTDGFVPEGVALRLTTDDCPALAAELVAGGMWDEVRGGYQIHDYFDYQPSRAEVLELRAKRKQAGSKGGTKAQANRQASARANDEQESSKPQAKAVANLNPVPVPTPKGAGERRNGSEGREAVAAIFDITDEQEHELQRLLSVLTEKDERTEIVLRRYAAQLPFGSIAKVRESSTGKPAAYACAALKSELAERGAA